MQDYNLEKARHDFEEDQRYEMEQELMTELSYAVKIGALSEDQAFELWDDKEKGFRWLFMPRIEDNDA